MEEPPSGPPPASASLEETRLKGHIGHLTRSEEKALVEFKKICAEKGFYTPESESALPSHDDGTLVYVFYIRHSCFSECLVGDIFVRGGLFPWMLLLSSKTPSCGEETISSTPYMKKLTSKITKKPGVLYVSIITPFDISH